MTKKNNLINITQFLNECKKIKNEVSEEAVKIDYNPVSCFEKGKDTIGSSNSLALYQDRA